MSNSYLKLFLDRRCTAKTTAVKLIAPTKTFSADPKSISKSSFANYSPKYKDATDFYKRQKTHINMLPSKPRDIKGVDAAIYYPGFKFSRTCRPIVNTEFMSLHFFPSQHFVSLFRKSNIAFIYATRKLADYNNAQLASAASQYKGKYRNKDFFSKKGSLMETAFGRTSIRKMIRKMYVQAIQEKKIDNSQDIDRLAGTYLFNVYKVPVNAVQRQAFKNGITKAIDAILTNRVLWSELDKNSQESFNFKLVKPNIVKEVSFTNVFRPENEPIRSIKLPFYKPGMLKSDSRPKYRR